ncbi:uncharacterized protein LOC128198734 [Bicyclus anynana]|uniref:Uncharacterized protein LOC128198734 n=1 Tax=Bicyclus anynana TaxID=110368 RepID=A0ABM3LQU2_BICAN|nr:uncharacterized protein LOC128198734 [Bicyclus anynana]
MPSCSRKNEAVSSKAPKDDGKRIKILSDLYLPAAYSQQASFADTDFTASRTYNNINYTQSTNKNTSHKCDVDIIISEWNVEDGVNQDVSKNLNNSYEELEEPFSPNVSEYIPETDSFDSDENISAENAHKRRRKRKKPNFQYTQNIESNMWSNICTKSDVDVILKPPIGEDPEASSPKSSVDVIMSTPHSSRLAITKITTPDSFKEILRTVQCQPKENKLNEYTAVVDESKENQIICLTSKQNRYYFRKKDTTYYEKFHFVASTSTIYNSCHMNVDHIENDNSMFDVTERSLYCENIKPLNQNLPIPSSSNSNEDSAQSTHINFIASQFTVYLNDENIFENNETALTKSHSRKRVRDESSWQVNKNKLLKNSGKRYHSKSAKKEIERKIMGDPCTCKKKCTEKIDQSERKLVFESYWQLANHERQWDYILKYVKGKPTRVALVGSNRPRSQTVVYTLPKSNGHDTVTVCKKMFLQTLNISDKTVYTALDKQEIQKVVDLRGQHTNRPIKTSESTTKSVIDHINMFPRKESHYLRKQTQREFLDEKLNCAKMHRLYLEWIKNNPDYENVTPASERWYYNIFTTKFNIGFFQPKKDLCETCSLYDQADSEQTEQLKEEYEKHIKNKELIRKIKNQEKEELDPKENTVACFDLEKVLYLPQSEVGVFHYKRKYPVYNFTVYNILTKSGHCYVWHAQIAKRGANEIASCLWCYLQSEAAKGIKVISFYSDNCTGQNRNRFVFALYIHASKELGIKITHRFLQKGHTQNEGDSMHSCIEKSKKNHVLYIPEEIYAIIRNAKVQGEKYNVKEMTQDIFFDFKKLVANNKNWEKDNFGNKVSWSKVKEISADPQCPGKLQIKYAFDDETPIIVDTNRSGRVMRKKRAACSEPFETHQALVQLYDAPLPIPEKLYKDLMSLCKYNYIPPHYQTFYKSLSTQSAATESDSEIEDNEG